MQYDAMIVGAGPAGCAAAYDLAARGRSVLLLDRRRFPRVKPCAGALTLKSLAALRYSVLPVVRYVARSMFMGKRLEERALFRSRHPLCAMTVRAELDDFCLRKTIERGAEFRVVEAWREMRETSDGVTLQPAEGETLSACFVVGADGANSQVRRELTQASGRPGQDESWFRTGLALEATLANGNGAEMEFDFGVPARGYSWVFPKGDHLNVGIYTSRDDKLDRRALAEYVQARLGTDSLSDVVGHQVGLGGAGYVPRSERIFLVGDAAGLVDALLGEGIYNAIASGQAAAAAIEDELAGRERARVSYTRRLRPIQQDVANCQWAADKFYAKLDRGYPRLISPVIRRALMQGYALGLTFTQTKKWWFVLPVTPVRMVNALGARRRAVARELRHSHLSSRA